MKYDFWEQVQSVVTVPATDNLRFYLSVAILPEMPLASKAPPIPPPGHKAHLNHLTVIPQAFRRLEATYLLTPGRFSQGLLNFLDEYVPSVPLDVDNDDEYTGESITVPCAPHYDIAKRNIGYAGTAERVCFWVIEYPLHTAQRIVHLAFPETDDWSFSTGKHITNVDMDQSIFRYTTFGASASALNNPKPSVTVVVQPPWILSPQDLQEFVDNVSLPQPDQQQNQEYKYNCERLWAKLWDTCFRERSHWFIVTSYFGWVFGAFSKGWTRAFVSPIFESAQRGPTVTEVLVYWLASAVGVKGGWRIPEVPEPVQNIGVESTSSIPPPFTHRIRYAESASDWSDTQSNSSDTASVAETEEVTNILLGFPDGLGDDQLSVAGFVKNPAVKEKLVSTHGIEQWRSGVAHDPTVVDRPPSPASSDSSTSTVRDHADRTVRIGDWLSGDAQEYRTDYM